ncbi:Protein BPS1 [Forsythia ovata]|uniref:Protein BPS1 n=1 Tax=Forsythia ovata TaxID=205694 RepID=A0ABD1VHH9_9LAMI
MVFSVERLGRSLKINNHQTSEALSASLKNFRSQLSNFLNQLVLKSEIPESEYLSLPWFHHCYDMLHMSNKSFAKLVVDIDYPMSKWGNAATEEYLNYSFNLLELLNSISSSLSHLSQAKLELSHALSHVPNSPSYAIHRLKKIQLKGPRNNFKVEILAKSEEIVCSKKERVILQALLVMKSTGLWVLGLVLSGLCSDHIKPSVALLDDSLPEGVESRLCKLIIEKKGVMEEVKELNNAVAHLAEVTPSERWKDAAKDMEKRLEVLENSILGIEKQTNYLFSEFLAARDKLLDYFRHYKT